MFESVNYDVGSFGYCAALGNEIAPIVNHSTAAAAPSCFVDCILADIARRSVWNAPGLPRGVSEIVMSSKMDADRMDVRVVWGCHDEL